MQAPTDDQPEKKSITDFFRDPDTERHINIIDHNCSRLYKLIDDGKEDSGNVPDNFSSISKSHLVDLSTDLFDALELHIKCNPKQFSSQDGHQSQSWHPTRLCLTEEKDEFPSISLLISPMQMAHWQDFHLIMQVFIFVAQSIALTNSLLDSQRAAQLMAQIPVFNQHFAIW